VKKWIEEKIGHSKLWLTYYPSLFALFLNLGILIFNFLHPFCFHWLSNLNILMGSIGITVSIRGMYLLYIHKKEIKEIQNRIDELIEYQRRKNDSHESKSDKT
jgi:hypothetical protein